MKRIPLVTLLVVALAVVLAGCGLLSQKTEPPSPTAPVKEVKMVHPSGIPVLMYHKIGDDKDNDAVIREDLFREQMKFLKDNGYNPLTMDQLYDYVVNGAAVPEKPVVLTFDDGYADTYSIVYPIMKEYGFAATVFINPGDITFCVFGLVMLLISNILKNALALNISLIYKEKYIVQKELGKVHHHGVLIYRCNLTIRGALWTI